MSLARQILLSILLVALAVGLWSGRTEILKAVGYASTEGAQATRPNGDAIRVVAQEVRFARDDLAVEALGTGRAMRSVALRPETAGKVVETRLAAGAQFRAGDPLLKLEDADERLAVALAEAELDGARRALERAEALDDRGVALAADLDAARTAARVAEIELERARKRLADRVLRAPFDGVASLSEVDVGDWIDTDDIVAEFDDRSVLFVEFEAPELLLPRLAMGMAVAVHPAAQPDVAIPGEIAAIDSRLDRSNRAARVRVAAPNPDDALRPGGSFTVRLDLSGERYPVVPELALQFSREGLSVWRIAGDTAERVLVSLVRRRADGVLVAGPLSEGDRVVVEGAQRLSPGRRIEAVSDPAARPQ